VKPDAIPLKIVKGTHNDKTKQAYLYSSKQTISFKNRLNPDGSLPANEYGNFELFNGPLPEGVVHISIQKIKTVCKKLGVEYREAVSGFDIQAGRSIPVYDGVITFKE